jgi:hypothetical protein
VLKIKIQTKNETIIFPNLNSNADIKKFSVKVILKIEQLNKIRALGMEVTIF